MKKISSILVVIIAICLLSACTPTNRSKGTMYIEKAELTQEEQDILKFVGSEKTPYILNFVVDDTVQSLQINTYELQGYEWKLIVGGGGQQLTKAKSRMALTFDNIGLGLRTAVEHKGSNSYKAESDFEFGGLSTTTAYLTEKTIVEYEKEIPLVIQIHTSKNNISSLSPEEGFYQPQIYKELGYEKVYAVTCLFSQKTVNELSE